MLKAKVREVQEQGKIDSQFTRDRRIIEDKNRKLQDQLDYGRKEYTDLKDEHERLKMKNSDAKGQMEANNQIIETLNSENDKLN